MAGQGAQQPLAGFMPQGGGPNLGIIPQSPALTGAGSDYSALFSQPEDLSQTASGQFITNVMDPIDQKLNFYNGAIKDTIAAAQAWEAQNKAAKAAGNPNGIAGGNAAATPAATAAPATTVGTNTAALTTVATLLQLVARQMQDYQDQGKVIPASLTEQAQRLQLLQQQLGGGAVGSAAPANTNFFQPAPSATGTGTGGAVGTTNNATMQKLANAADAAPTVDPKNRGICYNVVANKIVDKAAPEIGAVLRGRSAWEAGPGLDRLVNEGKLAKKTFSGSPEGRQQLLNSGLKPGTILVFTPNQKAGVDAGGIHGHIAVVGNDGRIVSDVKDDKDFILTYRSGQIGSISVYAAPGELPSGGA